MSSVGSTAKKRSVAWTRMKSLAAGLSLSLGLLAAATNASSAGAAHAGSYIVQGRTTSAAVAEVRAVRGSVLSSLPIIHGVVARLTSAEAATVSRAGLTVTPDVAVTVAGGSLGLPAGSHPSDAFTQVTGATSMWNQGYNGAGVTVAVLDTGIQSLPDFGNRLIGGVNLYGSSAWYKDSYGHGTFVAGLIAGNGASSNGQYTGVAPSADLVSIKVAGGTGLTSESTVIAGVQWAINHEYRYGIQVLNMSLGTIPGSPSADDPLDQAVEQAWQSGIVVVTSAGNLGPGNGSITSPGNDPLAITVGSMDDAGADNPANFAMSAFSGVGPTLFSGWYKPDLVAPGRSVVSLADPGSTIYNLNPQAILGNNFVGSGTSFSAAIVSGLAADLLQEYPNLTPDQVKAALLMSASNGPVGDPFVDGHGIANVSQAAQVAGQVSLNQGPAASAESSSPAASISLSQSWAASTWNPANWSGPAWAASPLSTAAQNAPSTTQVNGTNWNGAAWNGAAWNGAAWNGAAWNGAAWNGAAWNGAAWNGAAWNGAAWNGAAWNGAAWNDQGWS